MAKPAQGSAPKKINPPTPKEVKPSRSADSVSKALPKPDSIPVPILSIPQDSPRTDSAKAGTRFSVPLGGVVDLRDSLTANDADTIPAIRVMPGPGFQAAMTDTLEAPAQDTTLPEVPPSDDDGILRLMPSYMLQRGQWELKCYNQIYSQRAYYDAEGEAIAQSQRSSYLSHIFQAGYGLHPRFNIGLDAWLQSVLLDAPDASPFRILGYPQGTNGRTALTALGPRIRFQPFPRFNAITLNSTFLFPTASDPEGRSNGRPYLATENHIWWTQCFYTEQLGRGWQLFGELDAYWNINRGLGNGHFALPATAILSYFPTRRLSFMGLVQFWPTLGEELFSAWWLQLGAGAKYMLTRSLVVEAMYARFVAGQNAAGPADSFNLGIRFLKW